MSRKFSAGVISAFVIVTFLSIGAVFAQGPSNGYHKMNYVSVKGGIYSPTDDLEDLDTGFSGEITLNRYLSPYFALEAAAGYYRTSYSENGLVFGIPYSGDIDINIIPVTATGKGIIPLKFGEVYAGIGAGLYFVSGHLDANVSNVVNISSSASDSVWGMNFLGGISFDITDSFFVGVEGKYILTEGAELEDEIYGMKIEYPEFNLNGYTVSALLGYRF